ncbi:peptidase S24 and S26 domain protein [Hymenobacter roseosalivarius DSM 11622]|uniref:Peptidase S24 and S26 domain protein n=1 Tax=Hymenobacter roseosalivarius DSM 11622 TaxID=645990 RepID=A0A1W1W1X6_9BACT|nr:translesion error-prone DNA polymerase V autoproteolytic subunit [Hymenobacter roseosalivarius]SMB99625.1 peptidase S24 and S26 domain protein [Hymenobacter roseosalivarius DSM 11622]
MRTAAADLVAGAQQPLYRPRQPAQISWVGVGQHVPADGLEPAFFGRVGGLLLHGQVGLLLRHPDATYLMRVSGESMKNAEIHEGDLLAVDKQLEADHNHIVVAVVEGECTVKRLVCEHGTWWLKPENPDYKPWEIHDAGAVRIWGVVTHVLHELIPDKLAALLRTRD